MPKNQLQLLLGIIPILINSDVTIIISLCLNMINNWFVK